MSLGFAPEYILDCARRQRFEVGRCVYAPSQQEKMIDEIIDAVEVLAGYSDQADDSASQSKQWVRRFQAIEGNSMLIPWFPLDLRDSQSRMAIEHAFLAPISNIDLSMNSLALYLQNRCASPRREITYCDIPYRKR